tara:strand:+ start:313 stop:669 length:357 start_codon:yes stop_codon:yes gene_type:complete
MKPIKEDKIAPIIIDLNIAAKQEVNESVLKMLGSWIELILGKMFDKTPSRSQRLRNVRIRGNRAQIDSFANAVQGEAKFIKAYHRYGLDDPRTYKTKASLSKAVRKFEQATKLKWPFD